MTLWKEGACMPRLDWSERATRRASKLLCGESSGRGPSHRIYSASLDGTVLMGSCDYRNIDFLIGVTILIGNFQLKITVNFSIILP